MGKRQDGMLDLNEKTAVERTSSKKRKTEKNDIDAFVMKPAQKRRWIFIVLIAVVLLVCLAVFLVVKGNHTLRVTKVVVTHDQIPPEFDGFRILHLSDFNGKSFGSDNRKLIDLVMSQDFDVVLLTGDFLDAARSEDSFAPVEKLLDALADSGKPIYYVLGENDVDEPENAAEGWNRCIIPNSSDPVAGRLESKGAAPVYPITEITRGESRIFLTGIKYYEKTFDSYGFDSDKDFSICVTHAPIDYDVDKRLASVNRNGFNEVDFDLSISGHTLGGQYRLPLLKTIYLEGHGLFPQEDFAYGLHENEGRYSFITAGLGVKSGFRLFNEPEVAIIELRHGN